VIINICMIVRLHHIHQNVTQLLDAGMSSKSIAKIGTTNRKHVESLPYI